MMWKRAYMLSPSSVRGVPAYSLPYRFTKGFSIVGVGAGVQGHPCGEQFGTVSSPFTRDSDIGTLAAAGIRRSPRSSQTGN